MDERWLEIAVIVSDTDVDDVCSVMSRWAGRAVAVEELLGSTKLDACESRGSCRVVAYLPDDSQLLGAKTKLLESLWMLGSDGLSGLRCPSEKWTDEREWLARWRRFYQPLLIGRIGVVPSWRRELVAGADVVVSIDPGPAFGTGLHVSTQQVMMAVQQYGVRHKRVLDFGTGSGIIAIAASMLGAREVIGIDIDERAVSTARNNAIENEAEAHVTFRVGSLGVESTADVLGTPFDIVVANIIASVHVGLATHYPDIIAPGGFLILGGIIGDRVDSVDNVFAALPLVQVERIEEDNWVTLIYERS